METKMFVKEFYQLNKDSSFTNFQQVCSDRASVVNNVVVYLFTQCECKRNTNNPRSLFLSGHNLQLDVVGSSW